MILLLPQWVAECQAWCNHHRSKEVKTGRETKAGQFFLFKTLQLYLSYIKFRNKHQNFSTFAQIMNFSLNTYDRIKIQRLAAVLKMNNDAVRIFSAYLAACPNFITADMIQSICNEYDIPEENAFNNLLITT